ncbi:GNAT family N-acetyltransferase [Tenggerimyces flavus]|uniref:GNAT family N-acetyltransferase n=1 Tax=Tenggerimyces flavus TaxID=1708749 RepID=A0ABV7YMQ7_9ACTN|nr:GNAT family N-acetyltransferase [Tenggerimyces flavus]MBM7786214.1 RimJ/RimL family protein N-acetyltransferase [Tenggerimyces flavus]
MEPVTLNAGDVILRIHSPGDIDGIVDQCTDPETARWTTVPQPYERSDGESFVQSHVPIGWRDDTAYEFAIADAKTDEFLGSVGLRPDGPGGAELGFGLRRAARGRGVTLTAAEALLDWGFAPDGLGLEVVHWRAHIGNWASRRVAWRLGFRMEGAVRGLLVSRGKRYDGWVGTLRSTDRRAPLRAWYDVPVLTGERCVLRPFAETDVAAVVEGCTDPQTRHWLSALPDPYTPEDALGYIQSRAEEHASGRGIYWAAADPETGQCLGSFGLMAMDELGGGAEVGYWMHPSARGRGVATDAVRLLVRHATIDLEDGGLGLRRLTLRTASGNAASQRVAAKAGFERTGVERAAEKLGDGTFDDLVGWDQLLDPGA